MKTLASALLLAGFCACSLTPTGSADKPEYGNWGVDLTTRAPEIAPGDDFYRYVNGAWLDRTVIPGDQKGFGTFELLREKSRDQVQQVIQELAHSSQTEMGSEAQIVGDFYRSWMDRAQVEALGLAPLQTHLQVIAAIDNRSALTQQLGQAQHTSPFAFWILPDPTDASRNTVFIHQAGLGLPSRDHYLSTAAEFQVIRADYLGFVSALLQAAGLPDAADRAPAIIALETAMARAHWSEADNRQLEKIFNPMSLAELQKIAPGFSWQDLFNTAGLNRVEKPVVMQPSAFTAMARLIETVELQTWKDYLSFHFIRANSDFLPKALGDLHFDFYERQLHGMTQPKSYEQRGIDRISSTLGDAVGKLYVARNFSAAAKTSVESLVDDLLAALQVQLQENTWMDEPTREQALQKLSTFEPRIGYPDRWEDYTGLEIQPDDLLGNKLRLDAFLWQSKTAQLDATVDRGRWLMPPQVVNASYLPMLNQITFGAGILQPPFFDQHADAAVNYGAIGVVIGHEISHGYDDQGRKFDSQGRIHDWWTPATASTYQDMTRVLVNQYNGYSPAAGMTINGELTLGENISDLAGVELAYTAYQHYKTTHGEAPVLDGLTGDQRFFMATAQALRSKYRDEALREHLLTAHHSPDEFRVNGVLRNLDAWYDAFNVGPGHALYLPPEQRVRIWR